MARYTFTALLALSYLCPTVLAVARYTPHPSSPFQTCNAPPEAKESINLFNAIAMSTVFGSKTDYDFQKYYATVAVGEPAQEMVIVIDTGSGDMWLPSKKLLK